MLNFTKQYKMKLIKLLFEYRLSKKISQKKLAQALGVHYTTICEWERGKRKPNLIQTYQIKKFLEQEGYLKR